MRKFFPFPYIVCFFIFLVFPVISAYASSKYIKVGAYGRISKPGVYVFKKGSRLSDLLFKIYPLPHDAYIKNAFLYRKRLKKDNKVELRSIIREILHFKGLSRKLKNKIKNHLSGLKAIGRVIVHLKNPVLLMNTKLDIRLKNGDKLFIPTKSSYDYVYVEGAVKKQGKFKYRAEKPISYYIGRADGIASNSVSGYYYLIKANGAIKKISASFIIWNKIKKRWEFSIFKKPEKVEPGDIIFFPFNYGKITNKLTPLILAVYERTGRLINY